MCEKFVNLTWMTEFLNMNLMICEFLNMKRFLKKLIDISETLMYHNNCQETGGHYMNRIMNRIVRYLYNDGNSITNVSVRIERNRRIAQLISNNAQFIDTIEYNDGSYLDIYFDNGSFIGLEYDNNCKFVD